MVQVLYGFQPVGEVFAPFGCLLTDNTTPALNLKFGSFQPISHERPLTSYHSYQA